MISKDTIPSPLLICGVCAAGLVVFQVSREFTQNMDACYPLIETVKVKTHSKSMSRLARATIRAIGNGILPSGQVPGSPLATVTRCSSNAIYGVETDSRLRRFSAGLALDLKILLISG